MRDTRELDAVEVRILGCLLEKQQTTPEYYPLTMNALLVACNQKTNRDPVMSLTEEEVAPALERLQDEKLVWRVVGSRAIHYDHNLEKRWDVGPASKAILTLLFLRGPQTAGELRSRSERMYNYESLEEIEAQLHAMAAGEGALAAELPRRPGQKEARWRQLAGGGDAAMEPISGAPMPEIVGGEPLSQRVGRLESEVANLRTELAQLKARLGEE